jgi:hypothetical protein
MMVLYRVHRIDKAVPGQLRSVLVAAAGWEEAREMVEKATSGLAEGVWTDYRFSDTELLGTASYGEVTRIIMVEVAGK